MMNIFNKLFILIEIFHQKVPAPRPTIPIYIERVYIIFTINLTINHYKIYIYKKLISIIYI